MNLKKIMDLQMEIYINDEDNALIDKLKRDSAIERSDNEEKKWKKLEANKKIDINSRLPYSIIHYIYNKNIYRIYYKMNGKYLNSDTVKNSVHFPDNA